MLSTQLLGEALRSSCLGILGVTLVWLNLGHGAGTFLELIIWQLGRGVLGLPGGRPWGMSTWVSCSVFQGGAGRPHPGADEEGEQLLQYLGPAADRGLHGQHLPSSLPSTFHEYVGVWGATRSRGGKVGSGGREAGTARSSLVAGRRHKLQSHEQWGSSTAGIQATSSAVTEDPQQVHP